MQEVPTRPELGDNTERAFDLDDQHRLEQTNGRQALVVDPRLAT